MQDVVKTDCVVEGVLLSKADGPFWTYEPFPLTGPIDEIVKGARVVELDPRHGAPSLVAQVATAKLSRVCIGGAEVLRVLRIKPDALTAEARLEALYTDDGE